MFNESNQQNGWLFKEIPTTPGLIIEQPLHIPATESGSADGIRTHITLAENELSLLPLDDDAVKLYLVNRHVFRSGSYYTLRYTS